MEKKLITSVLRTSAVSRDLRDSEIALLADLVTVREYKAGDCILKPGFPDLKDYLLIVAAGNVEATFMSNGESVTLHQLQPGDIAGVISFVGGSVQNISATVLAKTDSQILMLERGSLESLLSSAPAVVYCVMLGVARDVYSTARRLTTQSVEMNNYIYHTHGRY